MQLHPESQVKLHVHNTQHVVQQVAHYEIDLGLIEGDCSHPDIEVQPWVEDELVVFCAPNHPLAHNGPAGMEALTHEAWILREHGSGTRLTFDQAMRHHRSALNIRPGVGTYRGHQAGRGIWPGHRLHLTPGTARRVSQGQLGGGTNAGPGPASPVLFHLAQAEVPDFSHARVPRAVPNFYRRSARVATRSCCKALF